MAREITNKDYTRLPIVGNQPQSEKEEKYLNEISKYEFYNLEDPGMLIKFRYGDTTRNTKFIFLHGGKYDVPRHVARHIENCSTPIHDWRPNGMGQMVGQKTGDKPRFQMRQVFQQ